MPLLITTIPFLDEIICLRVDLSVIPIVKGKLLFMQSDFAEELKIIGFESLYNGIVWIWLMVQSLMSLAIRIVWWFTVMSGSFLIHVISSVMLLIPSPTLYKHESYRVGDMKWMIENKILKENRRINFFGKNRLYFVTRKVYIKKNKRTIKNKFL